MPRGFQSAVGGASSEVQIIQSYLASLLYSGWSSTAAALADQMRQMGYTIDPALAAEIDAAQRTPDGREAEIDPHMPLGCLNNGVVLSSLHFASRLTDAQKRAMFKSSVRKIDVETSTQCNRRCSYCSNSRYDRRSANTYMTDAVFERLIGELAEIDYRGQLSFVGHNEPLMHADNLANRLAYARPRLPQTHIAIFSNGDYLNREILTTLENAGLDDLNLTIHTAPGKPYDECAALERIFDLAKKLSLKPVLDEFLKDIKMAVSLTGSPITVTVRHADMQRVGHNQGGGVPGAGVATMGRTAPCAESLFGFIVGYTGNVHPCSLVVADIPEHSHCIMGNIQESSIFDIYAGEKFITWRKQHLTQGPKGEPCSTCPCFTETTPANWSDMVAQAIEYAAAADTGHLQANVA